MLHLLRWHRLLKIKSTSDLGGAKSAVEVTDLRIPYNGLKKVYSHSCLLNLRQTTVQLHLLPVVDDESTDLWYQLEYGDGSLFVWQGTHSAYATGVGVDGKPEFKIVCYPTTVPTIIPSLLTVAIPGTPQQGVATGALTKTYGTTPLGTPTFTYVWKRANTAGGSYTNITGETSATYTPVADDVGKYLKYKVTATVYAGTLSYHPLQHKSYQHN